MIARGSSNAPKAWAKETLCFVRFLRAFLGSHWKPTGLAYAQLYVRSMENQTTAPVGPEPPWRLAEPKKPSQCRVDERELRYRTPAFGSPNPTSPVEVRLLLATGASRVESLPSQYGTTGSSSRGRRLRFELRARNAELHVKGAGRMAKGTRFVGMDVHAETIAVAVAEGRDQVRSLGTIANRPEAIRRLLGKLGDPAKLKVCYEAGPTGYALYWQLTRLGVHCDVIAPSLIPTKAGERIKTDRRDAEKLARSYRSGDLTPVWVPRREARSASRSGPCAGT